MADLVIVAIDLALANRERLEIALWDRRCAPNWAGWKGRFGSRKAKRCAERFPNDHIATVVRSAVEDVDAVLAVLGTPMNAPALAQGEVARG